VYLYYGKIRENKWRCVSSTFTIMEISDIIKDNIFVTKKLQKHWTINKILRERYRKDLNQNDFEDVEKYILNKIFGVYKFIKFLTPSEEGWVAALTFSTHSNISAPDIMQLATAWNAGCNILITSDKHFTTDVRSLIEKYKDDYPGLEKIKICTPEKFDEIVKEFKK
jgi:predicted nucleic acid-binding protein